MLATQQQKRLFRRILVVFLLVAFFAASVWNWLYNIPVQPNVEIPFSSRSGWMYDAEHPREVLVWPTGGPVSFYDLRTGELLYERRTSEDEQILTSPGDSRTTLVCRGGKSFIVDLRKDQVRSEIEYTGFDSQVGSCSNGTIFLVLKNRQLRAYDADTGKMIWSLNDVLEFETIWGGEADQFFAKTIDWKQVDGGRKIEQHRVTLRLASNGQEDPNFKGLVTRKSWIPYPPRFLVDTDPYGSRMFLRIYDLKTAKELTRILFRDVRTRLCFNSESTELMLYYRQLPHGCRVARWDVATGKAIAALPPDAELVSDVTTDDGRYSVGEFGINFPPGYERLRRILAAIGIQIPPRVEKVCLITDNQAQKTIGRLEFTTPLKDILISSAGDAFIQTGKDRLAVYFLPLRLNWTKLVIGALWMGASFLLSVWKIRGVLIALLGTDENAANTTAPPASPHVPLS